MQSPLANPARFVMAGKSRFTIVSKLTQTRFTYRVTARPARGRLGEVHFVSVLTGADNDRDYSYLGFIRDGAYRHGGAKSRIAVDAKSAKAFAWFFGHLATDATEFLDVYHQGACGRCGRALTVPESVQSGFGPECIRFVCAA